MKSLHKNVCLAEKKDGFDFIYDREISSAKQTKEGCKNSVRVFYSPFLLLLCFRAFRSGPLAGFSGGIGRCSLPVGGPVGGGHELVDIQSGVLRQQLIEFIEPLLARIIALNLIVFLEPMEGLFQSLIAFKPFGRFAMLDVGGVHHRRIINAVGVGKLLASFKV